jgi:transposase
MRYSQGFKASIIRKSQDGSGRSLDDLARESGVHPATLGRWIQKFRAGTLAADGTDGILPSQRHPGEKLALLLESRTVSPEGMGEWIRRHGLHSEHLPLWEQELTTMASGKDDQGRNENAQLRKENRQLQKELARKEKALAEAAVLLMLKKKHPALFEGDGES